MKMKLIRKIKIYYLTGNCKDSKVKKIIKMFDDIFNNMVEYYSDDYPKSVFYKYKGEIYFELDFKNDITRCRYKDFWRKFEKDFKLNYKEIKELTHYMLKMHLKKVPTTGVRHTIINPVRMHLKRKVPPTRFDTSVEARELKILLKRKSSINIFSLFNKLFNKLFKNETN